MRRTLTPQRLVGSAILDNQLVPDGVLHHAIILVNNRWRVIPDASLGTSLKPIVQYNGKPKVRAASEGTPFVLINNKIVPLPSGDTLLI